MVIVFYLPAPGQANAAARTAALNGTATPWTPRAGGIDAALPCAVIYSDLVRQYASYHDDGTLTTAMLQADPLFALDAAAANQTTVQQRIDTGITAMQNWLAANPNGAPLTAGQTAALVKMVVGLAKLARQALADTTGT